MVLGVLAHRPVCVNWQASTFVSTPLLRDFLHSEYHQPYRLWRKDSHLATPLAEGPTHAFTDDSTPLVWLALLEFAPHLSSPLFLDHFGDDTDRCSDVLRPLALVVHGQKISFA